MRSSIPTDTKSWKKNRPINWCARDRLDKKFRAYKSSILEKERQLFELTQTIGDAETAKVKVRIEVADLEGLMQSRGRKHKRRSRNWA